MVVPRTVIELNPDMDASMEGDDSSDDDRSKTALGDGVGFPALFPLAPPLGYTTSPDAPPSVP